MKISKEYIFFIIKFIGIFCILYFGTLAVIGLSTPDSYYSSFVDNYLDYVSLLRRSLLHTTKTILSFFGFNTTYRDKYTLMGRHGGIRMVYTCIGYGVMSFWAAFVFANKGTWKRKIVWIAGGLFALWCINVLRLSFLMVAFEKQWGMPLGWNHHTWFNIVAYLLILVLIYFYDKSSAKHYAGTKSY